MALPCPSLELNDGRLHPQLGFGTYKVGVIPASASAAVAGVAPATTASAKDVVLQALQVGYRFLDCAQFYGNERDVGAAIRASGLPRAELFLASKVWTDTIYEGPEAVERQVRRSLADLGTEYLDLCLVHWPVPQGRHVAAYRTLEGLRAQGLLRSIGVSNYTIEDYLELRTQTSVPPAVNQIEVNPFLYRRTTIDFFRKEGVVIQAYRPLRNGKGVEHPAVRAVAERVGRTPAQVLGRWVVQHGCVYLPKSEREERMRENAAVFDFELSPTDMASLDALTTPEALQEFRALYAKCVVRDTPLAAGPEGVRADFTVD